jgi:site-specific DNA recombinase
MPPRKLDAVYARYSSHSQDDSTSIEVQLEACRRKAEGECVEYIDRALTGRTIAGRPELQRLLEDAEAGKVARLFVYKFDRLGRAAATHAIVEGLEDCGVEVISVTEGTNPLARGVTLVVAADYSRQLGERAHDGLKKRHEQRCWTGGEPPYGFQIVREGDGRSRVAVRPDEAEVVRSIVAMFLSESVGMKVLARRLQDRGVPTRRGARWSFTTVRSMLTNRMYIGEVWYNLRKFKLDRQTGRRKPR